MAKFNPYLHFRGNTEVAFNFYKTIFGGEFSRVMRFKDLPQTAEDTLTEEFLNKIMFISLPLGKHTILKGSDALLEGDFKFGDNFHIAITAESKAEADKLFNALSAEGEIEMPLSDSQWGLYFGLLKDKFGVQWTVEFERKIKPN